MAIRTAGTHFWNCAGGRIEPAAEDGSRNRGADPEKVEANLHETENLTESPTSHS